MAQFVNGNTHEYSLAQFENEFVVDDATTSDPALDPDVHIAQLARCAMCTHPQTPHTCSVSRCACGLRTLLRMHAHAHTTVHARVC